MVLGRCRSFLLLVTTVTKKLMLSVMLTGQNSIVLKMK